MTHTWVIRVCECGHRVEYHTRFEAWMHMEYGTWSVRCPQGFQNPRMIEVQERETNDPSLGSPQAKEG
jgi:hypothetical protein